MISWDLPLAACAQVRTCVRVPGIGLLSQPAGKPHSIRNSLVFTKLDSAILDRQECCTLRTVINHFIGTADAKFRNLGVD
jgi:hypothetical protein